MDTRAPILALLLAACGGGAEPYATDCDRFCDGFYRCIMGTGPGHRCTFTVSEAEARSRCGSMCGSIAADLSEAQLQDARGCLQCMDENLDRAACNVDMVESAATACASPCDADGARTYLLRFGMQLTPDAGLFMCN